MKRKHSQNSSSEDAEPQYTFDVDSNALWVDTVYWTFKSDLKNMEVGHRVYSKSLKFSYWQGRFYLELVKISPEKFVVELARELEDKTPISGYCFEVSFTVVASTCARKVTYMNFDINNAPTYFTLDELLPSYKRNDLCMIKCVIWMHEYAPLDNDCRKEQESLWETKLKEIYPEYKQYEQMARIMGGEAFSRLFSGRQDYKFADYKSTLLLRSFRYSDKLLSKTNMHENELGSQESVIELGRILGYIRTGQERCISNKDCILLYASAFYCGLSYLKSKCRDYIKMNLEDVDFFIDVLTTSDMVEDNVLMDYAFNWYLKNKTRVTRSVQWINFKNRNYELVRGFRHSFLRREFSV